MYFFHCARQKITANYLHSHSLYNILSVDLSENTVSVEDFNDIANATEVCVCLSVCLPVLYLILFLCLHWRQPWPEALCFPIVRPCSCLYGCTSVPSFCWVWYFRSTLTEFLQIWYQHPPGLNNEQIWFCWLKVEVHIHCDLAKNCFGHRHTTVGQLLLLFVSNGL